MRFADIKNVSAHTKEALAQGIMRFPRDGEVIIGRRGIPKKYLLDVRGAGTNLELRQLIVTELIKKLGLFSGFSTVGGVAKSGTMWGAWVAWQMQKPFANILPEARSSGLKRDVEGEVEGRDVILIDNWVRTGDSMRKAIETCQGNGGRVVGVAGIASAEGVDFSIPFVTIWKINELLEAALQLGLINEPITE